jgi:hypothetical protein
MIKEKTVLFPIFEFKFVYKFSYTKEVTKSGKVAANF